MTQKTKTELNATSTEQFQAVSVEEVEKHIRIARELRREATLELISALGARFAGFFGGTTKVKTHGSARTA